MNRFNLIAFALTLGLAACGGSDTGDTKPGGGGGGGLDAQATWSGTGVVVSITDGTETGGYDFGMAQTGSENGWAGEDCLTNIPAGYEYMSDGDGTYALCHHITQTGGSLSTVTDMGAVSEGSTTLLSQGLEATITYVLFTSGDACWAWGDDVLYYDAYACTTL